MLTTPIFTRLLTSAEYGQYNVFNSWLSILTIFVTLNLSAGVYTQGLVKFERERAIFSSSLQGLTLIILLFFVGIYLLFQGEINEITKLSTAQMLMMFIIIWTNAIFGFWSSEQRVEYKYVKLVLITICVSVLNPLLGILLVLNCNDKVTARIFAIMLVQLVFYLVCFFTQIKRSSKICSRQFWKYALSFNLPLIPHYLSQTILNNSDRIMIDNIIGSSEAGVYSLAYSISMIMCLFSQALTQTLNPWFYQKIKQGNVKDVESVSYLSLGIVAFTTLILIIFAPEAVVIFAPSQYAEAVYCIPPVAMGMFFLFSFEIFGKFAFYYEKTRMIMCASFGAAIINIILNYFGLRLFGYMAAAYTTLICYIMFSIFHYLLMKKVCRDCMGVEPPLKWHILLIFAIGVLGVGFLCMLTYSNWLLRYSIIIIGLIIALIHRVKLKEIILGFLSLKRK